MDLHSSPSKTIFPYLITLIVLLGIFFTQVPSAFAIDGPVVVQTQPVASPGPALNVSLRMEYNNPDDYAIGQSARLVGEVGNPSGATINLRFQVSSPLEDEPDHQDEVLCQSTSKSINIAVTCTIPRLFFQADDVGTWRIVLEASGGGSQGSDVLDVVVQGFAYDERRPVHDESPYIDRINTWRDVNNQEQSGIRYEDLNFQSLLVYSEIPGVDYWEENTNDNPLPNGRYELHYMQPVLIPIVERVVELARADGIYLMLNDAWDQDNGHREGSKHYEGRAIDFDLPFTDYGQSPEDRRGLGRLAYLVEQALQETELTYWIWHEHDHVHLSINAERAEDLAWGYTCTSDYGCVPHVEHRNQAEMSGAAAAAMILEWQGWWIDLYEFSAAANPSGRMDGIECEAMAAQMNRYLDRGWRCMRTQSRDEALRIAAYFQALTSEDNRNGISFPVAIPMNAQYEGDYSHWVVVEGSVTTEDPRDYGSSQNPGAGSYRVKSLSVLDPSLPQGHLNARRTVTRTELEGNIDLDSEVLQNLGMTYLPSGPNNTYELIIPAGCAGIDGSLAKAAANVNPFSICSSQYAIVSPSRDDAVTHDRTVIVQALGPADATRAELTVVSSEGFQSIFTQLVPVYSSEESTVWEFNWNPGSRTAQTYTLSVSADYSEGQMHCGAVTVNNTLNADRVAPNVDILQPIDFSLVGSSNKIRVLAYDNHYVNQIKVQITGADSQTLTNYLGCGAGCYEFDWSPSRQGGFELKVIALDEMGNEGSDHVSVLFGQAPPITISLNLTEGQTITKNVNIEAQVAGGFGDINGSMKISGPENTEVEISSFPYAYQWIPKKNGSYTIQITAKDRFSTGTKSITVNVQLQNMVIGDWVRLSPVHVPGVRYGAMVTTGEGLVLFGGVKTSDQQLSNHLWKWDGKNWIDLTPSPLPSAWPNAIKYPDMAYDQDRNRLVLLAGDLWEYDLSKGIWYDSMPSPRPALWPQSRSSVNTAQYDPKSQKTVFVDIDYTWLWDGAQGTWERIHTPNINPYAKRNAYQTLALDDLRDVIVLYTTYYNAESKWYAHTWEWNGSSWEKVADSSHNYTPSGSGNERMISLSSGVLLVDGYYHYQDPKADFWLWDGTGWIKLQPISGSAPNTDYPNNPIAFDPTNDELVLLTTSNETWVYRFSLNPRMDPPTPYLFTGAHQTTGKLYGPGMKLSWTPTTNPNAAYYEIQYSENAGTTWQIYSNRRPIHHGGWINHHGNLECGHGFSYCLKRYAIYHYRVRVLDGNGTPLTDWSNVVSGRSFEWPTDIELSDPTPGGPYMDDETVKMGLKTAIGPYLYIDWVIQDHYTAHHVVEGGCKDGYYWQDPETRYCTLTIFRGSASWRDDGSNKLAAPALAQELSVEVWAKATGTYPTGQVYTDSDYRVLEFKPAPVYNPR